MAGTAVGIFDEANTFWSCPAFLLIVFCGYIHICFARAHGAHAKYGASTHELIVAVICRYDC